MTALRVHLHVMGTGVVVGVAAGEPADVARSTDALRSSVAPGTQIVTLAARGGAGFDELITHPGGVVVLVEAGAVVAPRCISLVVAAMQRTGAGLAGPSTNLAWNEQDAVAAVGRDPRALERDAGALLRRFGYAVRALDPPTLGDFCLAVDRRVIRDVGGADPAYGEGPRWELEYGARAAKAGYAGIWVCGAYAWRRWNPHPVAEAGGAATPQRRLVVSPAASSVPGIGQLPAHPVDAAAVASRGTPTATIGRTASAPEAGAQRSTRLPAATPSPGTTQPTSTQPRWPLVSCIMPTRDRPQFARQAMRYFLAQDYPNAELVVVEDGLPVLASLLPDDDRIRLIQAAPAGSPQARNAQVRPPGRTSIGALRNRGIDGVLGDIIVLWDDDDWHGPTRITDQVAPILAGTADITGLDSIPWFEPSAWTSWQVAHATEQILLRRGVYGGTIAFRRTLWQRRPFPDRSLAEDADFLDSAVRAGARLQRLDGRGRYVYVRHERNSWQLSPAGRTGWTPGHPGLMPGPTTADLAFYAALRGPEQSSSTLVSCIMPTRDRRAYVPHAIDYFVRQTHRSAELIVLDDGTDPVADLIPAHESIRYLRLDRPLVLGAKRNLACELAAGELIAHWDDDDWQAPERLEIQVSALGRADLCGASNLLFWDPTFGHAWRYSWPRGRRPWAAGTSLCYPRQLWRRRAFSEVAVGEDTRFVWQAEIRRMADVAETDCVVALVHPGNTVQKTGRGSYWATADIAEVVDRLGRDVARYTRATHTARPARPADRFTLPDPPGSSLIAAPVG